MFSACICSYIQQDSPVSPSMYDDENAAGSSLQQASGGEQIAARTLARHLNQWPCIQCTYENWPKASKCVMCGAARAGSMPTVVHSRSLSASPPCEYADDAHMSMCTTVAVLSNGSKRARTPTQDDQHGNKSPRNSGQSSPVREQPPTSVPPSNDNVSVSTRASMQHNCRRRH